MRTSQSFPFYPADFLIGTMFLTASQVGGFIRLLCFQWEQGSIPDELGKVATIAGLPESELGPILEKFERSSDGWRNTRLESVRVEREHYAEIQRRNGRNGGRPRKHNRSESDGFPVAKPSESDGLENDATAKPSESDGFPVAKPSESEVKADKSFPSPSPSPFSKKINAGGREGDGELSDPPTEEQALAYAADGSTVPITRDCVLRWLTDREVSNWLKPKGNHMIEVLPNWQADLRGYAMDWNKNEHERTARQRAGGPGSGSLKPTRKVF